ncbi:hypothetical protein SG34_013780 [Thalassomonas viridans]|uniref:Uncharacterized protein n=1 Tax=Thalassomonas viridans TaxID=137584 RepID=A0AAE9Z9M1_9GAMM|nr:hypothetical protein [Thalassomonas viridans]WDE07853.1 hypothetical protein SG34_013780 [Thalassomonas viridans]
MNFSNKSDAEILAIANPFLDNIIQASNELDYEKFSRNLSGNMKNAFSENDFVQQQTAFQQQFGKISEDREFIRCIRRQQSVSVLWVTSFEKLDGEVLAAMQIDEEDGEMKIFTVRIS